MTAPDPMSTHRAPCIDGDVCGETAHCPPLDAESPATTLYIVESCRLASGDVGGSLMTADGEDIHSHMSSSPEWLRADLTRNFGRAESLAERFGDFTVVYVSVRDDLPDEIAHHFDTTPEASR